MGYHKTDGNDDYLMKKYFEAMFPKPNPDIKFIAPLGIVNIKSAIAYLTIFSGREVSHLEIYHQIKKKELLGGN